MLILKNHKFRLNLVYVLGILFTLFIKTNFANHQTLHYDSLVIDNIITAVIFATYLFIFSVIYDNVNIMDAAWGYFGIILTIDSVIDINKREIFYNHLLIKLKQNNKRLVNFCIIVSGLSLIFMYSLRHLSFYYRGFGNLKKENEDFRYKEFRNLFKNKLYFCIISLLCLGR